MRLIVSLLLLGTMLMTNISGTQRRGKKTVAGDPELAKKISRFAPTVLTANTARLSAGDRKALKKIIEAAKLLDPLFLRQVWNGSRAKNVGMLSARHCTSPRSSARSCSAPPL